ncbi:MAG TPA: AraC family transcriptional regulator [Hyphomicrobium sp.]|jgi:AraC-like DNA-binding protein|nr:AraC family transcriptional regulator [Hyphomicrobium sp.]
MISDGRRTPFFKPRFDSKNANYQWTGYDFEEAESPNEPLQSHSWSKTTLLYVKGGDASLNWKHRGVWHMDRIRSGTVTIIRRDAEIQSAIPSGSIPMMVLQLDNSKLRQVAPDDVLTIDKSLETAQVTNDLQLATLMSAMSEEVRAGCPSGRLFAESISLALLAYIVSRYAAPGRTDARELSLTSAQRRILVEYIQENLTSNISVNELAGLVHMSPSHFTRVFKAAFGMTPYRLVMHTRIEGAKNMLVNTKHSASHVAAAYAFASQSHFTKVFRQFTGMSPKQYRLSL